MPVSPMPVSPNRAVTRQVPQHDPNLEPGRRSSFEPTPLPKPMPYTTSRMSDADMDDLTRVDPSPTGLAQAARRISGLIAEARGGASVDDLSAELDTRQRPRIDPNEIDRVSAPPPTVPVPLERLDELDDMTTPPPDSFDDLVGHRSSDALTPPPRGSEEPIGRSSRPSMPKLAPPRTSSRPPAVVAIPPKTSSRPPGMLPTPPVAPKPSRPMPSVPPPAGSSLAKVRPMVGNPAAGRQPMSNIPRDSDSELTRLHDRGERDDDD